MAPKQGEEPGQGPRLYRDLADWPGVVCSKAVAMALFLGLRPAPGGGA